MDSGDVSVARQEIEDNLMRNRPSEFAGDSSALCIDCDVELSVERQKLGNRKRCPECQEFFEYESKLNSRFGRT